MPLHLRSMAEELAPLKDGKSDQLRFNEAMHRHEFSELVDAIPTLPSLKHFGMQQADLQEADYRRLADALATRNDLEEIELHKSLMTDDAAVAISNALKNHPNLNKINISYCDLNAKGLEAFTDVIADSPQFRHLAASSNHWNQETLDKLALSLRDKPALAALSLGQRTHAPLDETALEQSLLQHPHPNLVTVTGVSSTAIDALVDRNLAARTKVQYFLKGLREGQQDYATLSRPDVLTPNYDATGRLQGWDVAKNFNLFDALFLAQTRRDAIVDYQKNDAAFQPVERLLDMMPTIAKGEAVTPQSLFEEDAQDIAPLHNPRTWQNHPQLLQALAEQKALTPEILTQETRRGDTLLESALRNLPTSTVIDQLAPHGIKLGKQTLLDAEGKPNKVLDIIISKGEQAQLFTYENWVGSSPRELNAVVEALPKELSDNLPPLNGLHQILRAAQPSRTGIGR
ncbi:MAG: hypothetical protein FJX23_00225 [Alphaproteobacteria bacterium]|nr:hypothetical protein [Alphaproteobacteria bacterium]